MIGWEQRHYRQVDIHPVGAPSFVCTSYTGVLITPRIVGPSWWTTRLAAVCIIASTMAHWPGSLLKLWAHMLVCRTPGCRHRWIEVQITYEVTHEA